MRSWILAAVLANAAAVTGPAQKAMPAKTQHLQTQQVGKPHYAKQATAKTKKRMATYVAQGPLPPETVQFVAATVVVVYRQGALAITAEDATLQEILDKVREGTGAFVQGPAFEQRITVRIEPQPPARTIAALVDGLPLDYAMLGGTNANDPLQRIIFSPRLAAGVRTARSGMDAGGVQLRSPALIQMEETDGDEGKREGTPAISNETRRSSRH